MSTSRRSVLSSSISMAGLLIGKSVLAAPPSSAEEALWTNLMLEDQQGKTFKIGTTAASLTLVTMWANWCEACLSEMPSLVSLSRHFGPRIEIIMLSHPVEWEVDLIVARHQGGTLRFAKPSPVNGTKVNQAALLNKRGTFQVPKTIAFRSQSKEVLWTTRNIADWNSAQAIERIQGSLL